MSDNDLPEIKPSPGSKLDTRDVQLRGTPRDYRRLWLVIVAATSLVSVIPLLIMTEINHRQYQEAFQREQTRPITRLTTDSARSLEFFLAARQSTLQLVVREMQLAELTEPARLEGLLGSMKAVLGGFVDLAVLDSKGIQVAYAGPYELQGQSYLGETWYQEALDRGAYTSEMFMGHRQRPHFVIAIRHDVPGETNYVLRASIDAKTLDDQIGGLHGGPVDDAFIVDFDGVLQTPSALYGAALDRCPLPVPVQRSEPVIMDRESPRGERMLIGSAYIQHSPFILMLVNKQSENPEGWSTLRRNLLLFLAASVLSILGVVIWGASAMVRRIQESDLHRSHMQHNMEYTSKLAAVGRLAAGVAHEVNNPLAIINEKAGLMKDLLTFSDSLPPKEKMLRQIEAILSTVDRCAVITHRLLGFAKHVNVEHELIDLTKLLTEVSGFLDREAGYRNIQLQIEHEGERLEVLSDRGQLQQVFLNILNNALAAVDDGGRIRVHISALPRDWFQVRIEDNGCGISQENLDHVFEPFFSTKGAAGTGLGLSITYGIVKKLGGHIIVESELGEGTTFYITLPHESTISE